MRSLYEPVSRLLRASNYRKAGRECAVAGFPVIASINFQMADILDPPKRDEVAKPERRTAPIEPLHKPRTQSKLGGDPSRVGGRRDGAPLKPNHTEQRHQPGVRRRAWIAPGAPQVAA